MRTLRGKRMKEPMEMPNLEGFKAIAVDDDGNEFPVTVKKDSIGCFSLYRDSDNSPCWMQIVGFVDA